MPEPAIVGSHPSESTVRVATAFTRRMEMVIRVARFVAVGVTCYFVQLGLLHVFRPWVYLYLADMVAFVVSAQLNFGLSLSLTWRDRRGAESTLRQWIKFNANALLAATVINAGIFWLLVHFGLQFWLAMLLANGATACCTFAVNHFFVFKAAPRQLIESRRP